MEKRNDIETVNYMIGEGYRNLMREKARSEKAVRDWAASLDSLLLGKSMTVAAYTTKRSQQPHEVTTHAHDIRQEANGRITKTYDAVHGLEGNFSVYVHPVVQHNGTERKTTYHIGLRLGDTNLPLSSVDSITEKAAAPRLRPQIEYPVGAK